MLPAAYTFDVMGERAPSDLHLERLAGRVGRRALAAGRRIVTAESCTAGWIAKALTDTPGSSQWLECGYVTYSNAAKVRDLRVSSRTLDAHGAVSEAVARQMARGALHASGAELAVAVTGVAGPDGGTPQKPVGTVWFCIAVRARKAPVLVTSLKHFPGGRDAVRRKSVAHALRLMARALRL
ncbi:MAG TPA: CinA family protein [Steroidobacteraceae bacterium]|nr:CinA family protein [Steroidobacteraceae bacterium]